MNKEKISYFASGFLALGLVPMTAVIVPLYALGIGASPAEVGIIMAMRSLLPFLLAIPGGAMVDRFGVRFVVTRLAFACAILSLVYPFTTSVFHLVLLQLVFGVCQSFCWIGVQTGIGKTYRGDPVVTSHLGFWSMGGTFFGPFIIGFIWDRLGADSSFITAALWCGLLSILALQLSQEMSGTERAASKRQAVKGDYGQAFGLLRDPVVFYIIACSSVRLGAVSLQTSFLPVYLVELKFSASQIGVLIGVSAISSAFSAFLHAIFAKWWSSEKILGVFIVLALLAVSAMSLTGSYPILAILNITMGLAIGVTQPAMFSVLGAKISKDIQGLVVGLRTSSNRGATFLIPLLAGLTAGAISTQWTFLIVGMTLMVMMLVTLWIAKDRL
jgi:MFS family permease